MHFFGHLRPHCSRFRRYSTNSKSSMSAIGTIVSLSNRFRVRPFLNCLEYPVQRSVQPPSAFVCHSTSPLLSWRLDRSAWRSQQGRPQQHTRQPASRSPQEVLPFGGACDICPLTLCVRYPTLCLKCLGSRAFGLGFGGLKFRRQIPTAEL